MSCGRDTTHGWTGELLVERDIAPFIWPIYASIES